ncbi:ATP-binding protein [Phytoactinopolyspora halotolerans]|uniref:ATP-binding protein n=2 Tax=Phytoactinopolyspora halotolerans TaxID=1981512 RepID=A0A6L9SE12_9ACTN|nr:ATP-binding protein [Phytoactinopolyspora halotolerans]
MAFIGRKKELARLNAHLAWVRSGGADEKGRAVLLRGRRRVGKSRLAEVFCDSSGLPFMIFQASRKAPARRERERFAEAIATSNLAGRDVAVDQSPRDWGAAFRLLAAALPDDRPSIVVIDELPYLVETDPSTEGELQTAWDKNLSRKPVLLLILGSDLSVMEALSSYENPFHQRAKEMVLHALNPADVAEMTGLGAADALDAYLITGGLPLVCQEWRTGWSRSAFLEESLNDPTSALIVSGERILAAEFPPDAIAHTVLTVIGGTGERTWTTISERAGNEQPLAPGTLQAAMASLIGKRVVADETPLSTKSTTKNKRYYIADPFLRFWLAFVEPAIPEVERGRGDIATERIERGFAAWRGRAIEPVIRDALFRLLPDERWPNARAIGGWWPRSNNPEIDLVGADRAPTASEISFIGSIKWLEQRPFDANDLAQLARDATSVPGVSVSTPLVAVSRTDTSLTSRGRASALPGLAALWGPDDLIVAWQS